MFILLVGGPVQGVTPFGPFSSTEEAFAYAEQAHKNCAWEVTDLHPPTDSEGGPCVNKAA